MAVNSSLISQAKRIVGSGSAARQNPVSSFRQNSLTGQQKVDWLNDNPAPVMPTKGVTAGDPGAFGLGGVIDHTGNYNNYLKQMDQYNASVSSRKEQMAAMGISSDDTFGSGGTMEDLAISLAEDAWNATEQANAEAKADREDMLNKLTVFDNQYNEAWMQQTLSAEASRWDIEAATVERKVIEQQASMGRVANPYMLAGLRNQMSVRKEAALQLSRSQLEEERRQHRQYVLSMTNDVYKNTSREVPGMESSVALLSELGKGASGVQPASMSSRNTSSRNTSSGANVPEKESITAQKNRQFAGGSSFGGTSQTNKANGLLD